MVKNTRDLGAIWASGPRNRLILSKRVRGRCSQNLVATSHRTIENDPFMGRKMGLSELFDWKIAKIVFSGCDIMKKYGN